MKRYLALAAIAQPLLMLRTSSVCYILTIIIASSFLSHNAGCQSSHSRRRPAQSSSYQYMYAHAFAPPALCSSCRPVHSALSVSRIPNDPSFFTSFNDDDDDDDDDRDSDANNSIKHAADPRTDVKSFLTQRSLQSLHYLLTTTRDQVSADWLELDFLGCEKGSQQAYHGTGAAYLHEQSQLDKADGSASFGSWKELIVSLIEQDAITKRVSLGKKYKGGDGGRRMAANSYLESLSSASSTGEEISSESTDGNSPKQTNKLHNPFGSPPTEGANTSTGAVPQPRQAPKSATSSYLESIGSSNSNGNTEPIDWSAMSSSCTSNNSIGSNESSSRGSSDVNCVLDDTFISSGSVGSVISGITSSTSALQSLPIDRDQFQRSLLSMRLGMKSRRKEKFHRSLLSTRLALESQRSRGGDSTPSAPGIIDCDDSINQASPSTLANYGVAPRPTLSGSDSSKRLGIDRERLAQDRERAFHSNPHMSSDDDEYYMDLEVDPKSLATRLLAVREQIALELVEDLTLIWKADKTLLTDLMVWAEENDLGEHRESDDGEEGVGSVPSSNAIKMHQELLASSGKASSSFRKGNLDLIFNLSTQAAIHRLLKQLMSDECIVDANCGRADRAAILSYNNACFRWLRDFYVDRVGDFFDGDVPFGRADDFFMEWLQQSSFRISDGATTKTSDSDQGLLNKVDPLRLAEEMVRVRSDIAMEWRKICRLVPEEDHGWIRLLIIEKRAEEDKGDDSIGGISGDIGLDDDFTDENGLGGFQ